MIRRSVRSFAAFSIVFAVACGDDDSGGGTLDTGLPPDQMLSELDSADAEQACHALVEGLDSALSAGEQERINCTVAAIPESVTPPANGGQPEIDTAMCRDLVDRCLGGEAIGPGGESPVNLDFSQDITCDSAEVSAELEGCEATVSEYESCINGFLARIDQLFSAIDCDALRDPQEVQELFGQGFDMSTIEQCNALETKCPGVAFGPSDGGGEPPP